MSKPDTEQLVKTRTLSWRELAMKAWGKDWNTSEVAYEFTNRKFNDNPQGGPYGYNPSDSNYADNYADNYA